MKIWLFVAVLAVCFYTVGMIEIVKGNTDAMIGVSVVTAVVLIERWFNCLRS